jgi:hypothetical protein
MTKEIVTINGVTVKVVGESSEGSCRLCAFRERCPSDSEENFAGVVSCVEGEHYYEKVVE